MAGKNTAAFGIYRDEANLRSGIGMLESEGFRTTDISVLYPENLGTKDFAHVKGSKAPEGAAAGAGSGAVVGGVLGWLAGVGAIAIPGVGPFLAAGPIMGALAGMGAGGTAGGLIGALAGAGIPEYEAKRYEGMIREGGILVSVHCDNSGLERGGVTQTWPLPLPEGAERHTTSCRRSCSPLHNCRRNLSNRLTGAAG